MLIRLDSHAPEADPDWDYNGTYHELWRIKEAAEKAIMLIGTFETATPESDREMRESLKQLEFHLSRAESFLGVCDD